jgi:hypothetical protein
MVLKEANKITSLNYPYEEIGNFASKYVLIPGSSAIKETYILPGFVYRNDANRLYEIIQQLYYFPTSIRHSSKARSSLNSLKF